MLHEHNSTVEKTLLHLFLEKEEWQETYIKNLDFPSIKFKRYTLFAGGYA